MKIISNSQPATKQQELDSYEKGLAFEEYIISLFNKDSFWLLERQASKRRKQYNHLDLNYPDLYLLFAGKRQYRFAVECKFRSSFNEQGQINWAKDKEIRSYKSYQAKFNITVFIAIGVGGHPSGPEKLFVTPLQNICKSELVHENQLIRYKRKPGHKFFYDTVQLKLF